MHAVLRTGGHQFRVTQGDIIDAEKIEANIGDRIEMEVLLISSEEEIKIGTPVLENAKAIGRIMSHLLDKKVVIGKFKKRKRYTRKAGHRQELTRIKIEEIVV